MCDRSTGAPERTRAATTSAGTASATRPSPRSRYAATVLKLGRVTAAVLVDHIVPLPASTHDRENLQPL